MRFALSFLTVLPVGKRGPGPSRWALFWFAPVGVAIGLVLAGVGFLGARLWGPLAGAALVLLAEFLLTGGLHLDALADVADGLYSRRPPAQALEAMRDPRIGALGAASLAVFLLLRLSFFYLLISGGRWLALALPACVGRAGMVVALALSKPPEGPSLARQLQEVAAPPVAAAASLAALAMGGVLAGGRGVLSSGAGLLASVLTARGLERRWGWLSGDCVGTSGALAELVGLACLASGALARGV